MSVNLHITPSTFLNATSTLKFMMRLFDYVTAEASSGGAHNQGAQNSDQVQHNGSVNYWQKSCQENTVKIVYRI